MKKIIGVVGTIASGKDFAAEHISKKLKVPCYQISQPLRDIAELRGISIERNNLLLLGKELVKKKGDNYLARLLTSKAKPPFVIAGMRQLGQISFLRQNFDMVLISVSAPEEIRFERTKETKKPGEATNLKEFIKREKEENSGENSQRVFECMKLADYHVENIGTDVELFEKIDKILSKEGFI